MEGSGAPSRSCFLALVAAVWNPAFGTLVDTFWFVRAHQKQGEEAFLLLSCLHEKRLFVLVYSFKLFAFVGLFSTYRLFNYMK